MMDEDDEPAKRPLNIGFQLADDAHDDFDSAGMFAEAFCADVADFLKEEGVHLDVWHCSAELVFGVFCFKLGPASVILTLRRHEDGPDGEEWWLNFSGRPHYSCLPAEHRDALVTLFAELLGAVYGDGRVSSIKATLPPGMTLQQVGNA